MPTTIVNNPERIISCFECNMKFGKLFPYVHQYPEWVDLEKRTANFHSKDEYICIECLGKSLKFWMKIA